MKVKFKYQGVHNCEAVVLTCIDFRFWKAITEFAENELGIQSFDFPSVPGAAKAINECADNADLAMQCVNVPCNLHHAEKIVIVNHQDCGAYGGSGKFNGDSRAEQEFHEEELKKAKKRIMEIYPDKEVITAFAKISGDKENIELLTIT